MLVFLMLMYVSSCSLFEWDDYGNTYSAKILNNTDDTLLISRVGGGFAIVYRINESILYPDSLLSAGVFEVDEGDDPIKNYFDNLPNLDTMWIYNFDKEEMQNLANFDTILNAPVHPDSSNLLNIWTGPLEHFSDSIHRFNNYNSWEISKEEKIIRFTICEEDLDRWEMNNK
ncbi:MAG: hypothetical protein ACQES1_11075 [Bacteroidota bacterium]